ncbi:MAG: DUF3667 domain-containing protein [Saprospiraceae bacterium]|nr:DUF3667 domain-containing protein [Saprospiraceae bacterium]
MRHAEKDDDYADLCPSCNKVRMNEFCHHCGEQRQYWPSWSLEAFWNRYFAPLSTLDAPAYHTLWRLFNQPGQLTLDYWGGRRKPYLSPAQLLFGFGLLFYCFFQQSNLFFEPWAVAGQAFPTGIGIAPLLAQKAAALHLSPEEFIVQFDATGLLLSKILLLLTIPAFAWALYRLYWFQYPYYLQHTVFATHFLIILLFCCTLLTPLAALLGGLSGAVFGALLVPALSVYLYRALRRSYQQGHCPAVRHTAWLMCCWIGFLLFLFRPLTAILVVLVLS